MREQAVNLAGKYKEAVALADLQVSFFLPFFYGKSKNKVTLHK